MWSRFQTYPRSFVDRLYCDVVNDSLAEFSYNADIAGLTYRFLQHTTGLLITTHGYNDKMSVLVENILDRIKNFTVNPERLEMMKEQVRVATLMCLFSWTVNDSGEKDMGKFLHEPILSVVWLLWKIPYGWKSMDCRRETQRTEQCAFFILFSQICL